MKINIFSNTFNLPTLSQTIVFFYLKQEDNQGYENKTVQFLI